MSKEGKARAIRPMGLFWALVALAGCDAGMQLPPPPVPKVTVVHPEQREVVDYDVYNGWLQAVESVEVRARVSGYLTKINFEAGEIVEQGRELFEIDQRPFQAEVDRCVGEVARWQAELERTSANMARAQKLQPTRAITQEEYDRTVAERAVAVASLESARATLETAQLNLGFTKVTAPISGVISRNEITEGNLVQADQTLLTRIVSINPFYCYFNVDERSLQRYQKRDIGGRGNNPSARLADAQIKFDFGLETDEGFPNHGLLDFADNEVDSHTGTILVRGVAENTGAKFISGERVRVRVPASVPHDSWLVPDEAILSDQDHKYLLVVNQTGVVVRRDVRRGRLLEDGMRTIYPVATAQPAISADEWVIVEGLQSARVNYPVEPYDRDGKPLGKPASGAAAAKE